MVGATVSGLHDTGRGAANAVYEFAGEVRAVGAYYAAGESTSARGARSTPRSQVRVEPYIDGEHV